MVEGEKIKLKYVCRCVPPLKPNENRVNLKGLVVFTNDNMIYMEKQSVFSSRYSQRVRLPLEEISGITTKRIGGFGVQAVRLYVGGGTQSGEYHISSVEGKEIEQVEKEIQTALTEARQEKKRLAQEALSKGTVPTMIFCKFCGARNKADSTHCANCGAVLT
ncbi:MAG: hypothetical protein ABSF44_06810 [Candidatus Bathyarchaeia archaeon]